MADQNRPGTEGKPKPKRRHSRHRPKPSSAPPAPQASVPQPGPSQPRQPQPSQHRPNPRPPSGGSQNRRNDNTHRPQPEQPAASCSLFGWAGSGSWAPIAPDAHPAAPAHSLPPGAILKVLTYNTWSSSPTHSPFQAHSLIRTLGFASRDGVGVIALQEVTPEFGALVRSQDWVKRDWLVTSVEDYLRVAGDPTKGGGGGRRGGGGRVKEGGKEAVMLMVCKGLVGRGSGVKLVRMVVPKDDRGRAIIVLDLHHNDRLIARLCTSHYTALPLNAHFRFRQYKQSLDLLFAQPRPPLLLVLADTNAANELELSPFRPLTDAFVRSAAFPPPPAPHSSPAILTAYQEGLFAAGPTFGHLYPWVPGAPRKKPRKPRRLDRVWIKGAGEVVAYGERGGQEPVREGEGGARMRDGEGREGWMWESDHIGVEVTVRITQAIG